jgi:hypothetical protein
MSLTLDDLGRVPSLNDVNCLCAQAIRTLHDDKKSVDEMYLADQQARNVLTDTLSHAQYLVQLVRSLPASEQALAKMAQVILPGLITGSASRFVIEILYVYLRRYAVILTVLPWSSEDRLEQLITHACKLIAVTLVYARATGYISLRELDFHTFHTIAPPTCARAENYDEVNSLRSDDGTVACIARIAVAWNAQIAVEERRHQVWIAQVIPLLLAHTPLPEVLITLIVAYP